MELFHNVENACFADIVHGGHRETWPTKSIHFKHWLTGLFYKATGTALKAENLTTAINAIEAKARFESPQREVHLRVGGFNGKFYLDLGNKDWEVVEIDADGWRIIKDPPIRFRRTRSTLPLGAPVQGGSVELLRKYVNVKTDDDFVLLVFWLLAGIRPAGPYPILMVSGEHGAAKSTATKVARSIVDPNVVDVRSPPKDDQNLFIAAENSHILAYDNISNLPPWLSDSFCRIATGAGYASRKLYEDNEEVLLNVIKPLVLNGINEMVSRADLTDRAILLNLAAIGDKTRISEEDLWRDFEADRPRILCALLDAVAHGIKTLPSVKLERLPRMADFAKWSNACEEAVFKKGTFTRAYNDNINETIGKVIENDVVASAVIQFFRMLPASTGRQWIGSAEELLHELRAYVPDQASHQNEWPKNGSALSRKLIRIASPLRRHGIDVRSNRSHDGRYLTVQDTAQDAPTTKEVEESIASGSTKF